MAASSAFSYGCFVLSQILYDAAVQHEASSDWLQAAEKWRACVNETLWRTDECRVQCEVAPQLLPEDRGLDGADGVFEKAAGGENEKAGRAYL